jgi:hypothetical protein
MNLFLEILLGLLGRGISPSQGHYLHRTAQHRKLRTYIHASSGIRNHDASVRSVEDRTRLRTRDHWDWFMLGCILIYLYFHTRPDAEHMNSFELNEMINLCDTWVIKSFSVKKFGTEHMNCWKEIFCGSHWTLAAKHFFRQLEGLLPKHPRRTIWW